MMVRTLVHGLAVLLVSLLSPAALWATDAPIVILQDAPVGMLRRNDGWFEFYNLATPHVPVVRSTLDGGEVALEPGLSRSVPSGTLPARMLEDDRGELHEIFLKGRGEGRRIGVDRFIDLWHRRTTDGRSEWEDPQPVWEGYCGALMHFVGLRSGRIVAPFGEWIAERRAGPPSGPNVVTAVYSDDRGASWQKSPAQLVAPCFANYNGSNYGACEPAIFERTDGRIEMLMRSQTGFLYASHSTDQGATWQPAVASRFHASTGPPGLTRLADGRIVVLWNNCEMPPRVDGQGVYAGRDALHAAISDDEGATWRGFREVYRDPFRNETPPRSGDRGTAYPFGVCDQQGRLLVVTGQGRGRRNLIRVEPDWLTATTDEDDFSAGLDRWHVFKSFGPASGYWRDRTVGPVLVEWDDATGGHALHLRRPDANAAEGATWNFPLGWRGTLTMRVQPRSGFGGASIALLDRMFEPTDEQTDQMAIFHCQVAPDGTIDGGARLKLDRWQTISLRWDLDQGHCELACNGETALLPIVQSTLNGICYLQLRSLAEQVDPAGFLVDWVRVTIDEPTAPPRDAETIRQHEQRYHVVHGQERQN